MTLIEKCSFYGNKNTRLYFQLSVHPEKHSTFFLYFHANTNVIKKKKFSPQSHTLNLLRPRLYENSFVSKFTFI